MGEQGTPGPILSPRLFPSPHLLATLVIFNGLDKMLCLVAPQHLACQDSLEMISS